MEYTSQSNKSRRVRKFYVWKFFRHNTTIDGFKDLLVCYLSMGHDFSGDDITGYGPIHYKVCQWVTLQMENQE